MKKHLLALSLAVLCPAVLGILNYGAPSARNGIGMTNVKNLPGPTHGASPALAPEAMPGGKSPSTPPLPDRAMSQAEITQLLNQVLTVLRGGDAAAISQALAQLDEVFAGKHHDTGAGIAAILAFLESGQDAATGEGFLVGAGGILTEATTLRVFLMD